jgi:hypothetical protein
MQRDTAPGKSFHVWHRCTVIDRRTVLFLLLENREYAGGCYMARPSAAHRGRADQDAVAINVGLLFRQADHHHHGSRSERLAHPQKLASFQLADRRVDSHRGLCPPKRYGISMRRI